MQDPFRINGGLNGATTAITKDVDIQFHGFTPVSPFITGSGHVKITPHFRSRFGLSRPEGVDPTGLGVDGHGTHTLEPNGLTHEVGFLLKGGAGIIQSRVEHVAQDEEALFRLEHFLEGLISHHKFRILWVGAGDDMHPPLGADSHVEARSHGLGVLENGDRLGKGSLPGVMSRIEQFASHLGVLKHDVDFARCIHCSLCAHPTIR